MTPLRARFNFGDPLHNHKAQKNVFVDDCPKCELLQELKVQEEVAKETDLPGADLLKRGICNENKHVIEGFVQIVVFKGVAYCRACERERNGIGYRPKTGKLF